MTPVEARQGAWRPTRREFLRAGAFALGVGIPAFLAQGCGDKNGHIPGIPDSGSTAQTTKEITGRVTPHSMGDTKIGTPVTATAVQDIDIPSPSKDISEDYKFVLDKFDGFKVAIPSHYEAGVAPTATEQFEAKDIASTGMAGIEFYNKTPHLTFLGQIGYVRVPKLFTLDDCFTDQASQIKQLLERRKHVAYMTSPISEVKVTSPHNTFTAVKRMTTEINTAGQTSEEVDMHFYTTTTGFLEKKPGEDVNKFWMLTAFTPYEELKSGISVMETCLQTLTLS